VPLSEILCVQNVDEKKPSLNTPTLTYDPRVKEIIDGFLTPSRAKRFSELEELGSPAVPAMIRAMDDRRQFDFGTTISLVNKPPGAFEGIRYYAVSNVLQALDAILQQITDTTFAVSFNSPSGNPSEDLSLNGWPLNLLYRFPDRKR
jgi:hypothetical protein